MTDRPRPPFSQTHANRSAELADVGEDVWLEVVGAPVTFEDPASRPVGQCAAVAYETLPQTLRLGGSPNAPFIVNSERFGFRGERLWLERRTGVGRIEGRGTMTVNDAPAALLDPIGVISDFGCSRKSTICATSTPTRTPPPNATIAHIASTWASSQPV